MKSVYFLRHFNDIDHIAPIIWHCLEKGDDTLAVLLDRNYPAYEDPRLKFLNEYDNFDMEFADSFLGLSIMKGLFELSDKEPEGKVYNYIRSTLQKSGVGRSRAVTSLKNEDPGVCVFEWGSPYRTSHREFFEASNALEIPKLCFPHGLNIYLNRDINPWRKKVFEQGKKSFTSRNRYDAYVTQSEHDREQESELGINPNIHYVLGSARYYPEWQSINKELYETYDTGTRADGKTRSIFMLPHWRYNVNKEKTLRLISDLSEHEDIYLIVKEHTRGDSLPEKLDRRLVSREDSELVADVSSVSLIKWSDVIINFGSSIGIEALLQDKHHVNPAYLHSNKTIFDEIETGLTPDSKGETVSIIREIHEGSVDSIPEDKKRELYEMVIYGGREEHNVLNEYRELMLRLSQSSGETKQP